MRRIEWIDVAKGLTIILIVMLHSRDYALSLIPPGPEHPVRWTSIDPMLVYIRLPLFFLLSGMLASGALAGKEVPQHYNVRRTLTLLGIYIFWSLPLLAVAGSWPSARWDTSLQLDRIVDILRGGSVLWYLWAVPIAFVFAQVTRSFAPLTAVIFATAVGLALREEASILGGSFGPLGRCLPYYVLGIRYPFAIVWLASLESAVGLAVLLSSYFTAMAIWPHAAALNPLREVLGIALAVVGIGWGTTSWPSIAGRLAWLGRRTLPIYIFHFPLLAWLGTAAVRHGQAFAHWPPTLLLFLPLLSASAILLSLGLSVALNRLGLGWMLAMRSASNRPRHPVDAPRRLCT